MSDDQSPRPEPAPVEPPQATDPAVIEAAIVAVGQYERAGDWRLEPEKHARRLPIAAAPLARILRSPAIMGLMDRFTAADAEAVASQRSYKRYGRLAIVLHAAAIIIGAMALTGQSLAGVAKLDAGLLAWIGQYVALLETALIIMAIIAAQIIIRLRPFDKWMRGRAEAEITRVELFRRVAEAEGETRADEIPALPLQLEYFRRYQLGTQLDYYAGRGEQHARAAKGQATRRDLYTAVAAFAAAPATYLGLAVFGDGAFGALTQATEWADQQIFLNQLAGQALFFAGVIAASLMSANNALSLLSQDRRNASRYASTYKNLRYLEETYLEPARAAAADGDRQPVLEFIALANAQISSEHQEWISLQDEAVRPEFETIAGSRVPALDRRRKQV